MAHFFQNLYFSGDAFDVLLIFDTSLLKNFYCDLDISITAMSTYMFVGQNVSRQFNFSERSLTKTLVKNV